MSYPYNWNAVEYLYPRQMGEVHFELYARTSPRSQPFPHPPELRTCLSEPEWQERTFELWQHFQKWSWTRLERIGVIVALGLSGIVPVLTSILVNHFKFKGLKPLPDNATDQEVADRIAMVRDAHMITAGIAVGFWLLVWAPYLFYKASGTRRLRGILMRFNAADASKGTMQALRWSVVRSSTFHRSALVCVSLPPAQLNALRKHSSFSEGAYLPPYLAKQPEDGQGQAPPYVPKPEQEQGGQGHAPPAGPPPAREPYGSDAMRLAFSPSQEHRV